MEFLKENNFLTEIDLVEMVELEEMVCLASGGTISCCNGRDGNTSVTP